MITESAHLHRFLRLSRLTPAVVFTFWLKPFIIAGILVLSFVLPFKAPSRFLILIPGLIFGLFIALVILRWPPLGLLAIVVSRFIPFSGPSSLNAAMIMVGLSLGLWLLCLFLKSGERKLVAPSTMQPLLIFVAIAILAFGFGQLPWFYLASPAPLEAQVGGLLIFILSAGAFIITAHQLHDLRWLEYMTWIFCVMGALYMLGRVFPEEIGQRLADSRIFRGTSGSLFWVWLVSLTFSQAAFNKDLHPIWRFFLASLTLITLYIGTFDSFEWKSGWIPPLAALVAIIGLRYWKFALFLSPFLIVPAIIGVNQTILSDTYSYSTRIDAWDIVLEIVKVNPILGLGPSNYNWYTPLFPIRGYSVQFNSHNQYVDIIAQIGFLGLFCFLWFLVSIGKLGWQFRNRAPEGFAHAYIYGALGGLVGTIVAGALGDWVIPYVYNVGFYGFRSSVMGWIFLGGLVAITEKLTK